jgi:hypothetical protein
MITYKNKNLNKEMNAYPIKITGVTFGTNLPARVGNLPRDSTPVVDTAYFDALNPYNATAVAGGATVPAGYVFNGNVATGDTMNVVIPEKTLNYEQISKIFIAFEKTKHFVDKEMLPSQKAIDRSIDKYLSNTIEKLYKNENSVEASELETLLETQIP